MKKNKESDVLPGQLELTWPDCPLCLNGGKAPGVCEYKEVCYIEFDPDQGCQVGFPTHYKSPY